MQTELPEFSKKEKLISIQKYLEQELLELESGNSEFISLEELDNHLEKTIQDFEK